MNSEIRQEDACSLNEPAEYDDKKSVVDQDVLFAIFFLENQEFAIDVKKVREAVPLNQKIIGLPASIDIVEGLINLRGRIIPVINLKKRFMLSNTDYNDDCRIAVTKCFGRYFGIRFDDISEVLRLKASDICNVESVNVEKDAVVGGVINLDKGKRIIQVIDPDLLLKKYDLPMISDGLSDQEMEDNILGRAVETLKIITFSLEHTEFAMNVIDIREIIKVPEISRRVLVDEFIKGVLSVRGELITVVDLRVFMGLDEKKIGYDSRIIIVEGSFVCGFLVDAVNDVLTCEISDIKDIPMLGEKEIQSAYNSVIILEKNESYRNLVYFNVEKLFNKSIVKRIEQNIILHSEAKEIDQSKALAKANTEKKIKNIDKAGETKVYVSFMLDDLLGIDILNFQEIISYDTSIIPLPGQAESFEGILNLRGKIIPIINLRKFLGREQITDISASKILILKEKEILFGLIIDEVKEIIKAEAEKTTGVNSTLIKGKTESIKSYIENTITVETSDGQVKTIMLFNVKYFFKTIDMEMLFFAKQAISAAESTGDSREMTRFVV